MADQAQAGYGFAGPIGVLADRNANLLRAWAQAMKRSWPCSRGVGLRALPNPPLDPAAPKRHATQRGSAARRSARRGASGWLAGNDFRLESRLPDRREI